MKMIKHNLEWKKTNQFVEKAEVAFLLLYRLSSLN